jgi:pilus assembly protein Flp/PilA
LRRSDDPIDIVFGYAQHFVRYQYLDYRQRKRRMAMVKTFLSDFISDESGQDLIEYALVAAIIALGATAAMTTLAKSITAAFTKVGTSLTNAV